MLSPAFTLPTRHVGRSVFRLPSVASTNDIDPPTDEPGTVMMADVQTAGRGQYGRVWQAAPGAAVLFSVFLDPPPELRRPVVLTAWAAVAVAEAVVELTGIQPAIKWPNDVLAGGKKVCGILIEQRAKTVAGVGLNANQTAEDFEAAGLPAACSLAMLAGKAFDPREVLTAVLLRMDAGYDLLSSGRAEVVEAEWRWRLGLLGRTVRAELAGGKTVLGRLRGIGFDGVEIATADSPTPQVLKPEGVRGLTGEPNA